jgi:hypothetical protein
MRRIITPIIDIEKKRASDRGFRRGRLGPTVDARALMRFASPNRGGDPSGTTHPSGNFLTCKNLPKLVLLARRSLYSVFFLPTEDSESL